MNAFQALFICMSISLITSGLLLLALSKPLGAFIGKLCLDAESTGFWQRFTLVMLFLVPLLFTLIFGTPGTWMLERTEFGDLMRRAVTSTSMGAFVAVIGMGFWVSALARRAIAAAK